MKVKELLKILKNQEDETEIYMEICLGKKCVLTDIRQITRTTIKSENSLIFNNTPLTVAAEDEILHLLDEWDTEFALSRRNE